MAKRFELERHGHAVRVDGGRTAGYQLECTCGYRYFALCVKPWAVSAAREHMKQHKPKGGA